MNISSNRLVGIELKRAKKVRYVIIKYKFSQYFACFFKNLIKALEIQGNNM